MHINNNVSNFDEEPMEVDPGTPLFTRQLPSQQNQNTENQPPTSPNSTKINRPKIVKPVRPPPRMVRPPLPNDNDFDADINPFQTRAKIGFDSATSSSSSISNENNQDYFLKEDINPFNTRRSLARSPSPNKDQISQEETNGSANDDEWETHKKRSNSRRSVNNHHQNNQLLSPTINQSSSVSVVSSTTDLSSTSSISPQENQVQNQESNEFESNDSETKEENINENFSDPFNTPPKANNNKITSRSALSTTLTDSNNEDSNNFAASGQLLDFSTENQIQNQSANTSALLPADCVIFDSIFSNESEFQSFLDYLENKEKDSSIVKKTEYSEFARKSLYLQFDPIIQNCRSLSPEKIKRLSIIRDKQETIKFFLSEIVEEENEQTVNTTTNLENQSLVDSDKSRSKIDLTHNESINRNINVTRRSSITMDSFSNNLKSDSLTFNQDKTNTLTEFQTEIQPEELFDDRNSQNINESKFKNSISSNTSLNQSKTSETANGPNASILDFDRINISNKPNANETNDSFKLLTDDSMLDDIQLFNKQGGNANSVNINRTKIQTQKTFEKKSNSLTSSVTSVTGISDDESSLNPSMSKLIAELNAMKEKEKSYQEQIRSLDEENKKFRVIVVEFETIIQNMDNNREESESKLRNELIELTKERDHLQEDVIGVERAFDDLHRRFEKLKLKVEEFKKNEDGLQKAIESYKQQLEKEKLKYSTLKKHAEEKLEFANNEIDKLRKSTAIELQTLRAELRKAEIKISSLELTVQQKDQENTELTNLLEDLLAKVKPNQ
ncbi:unnamed protein product [Brachionus calyciflorus]|uniref:Transforming acidic coiled-coil-containing protein C-terminal domain-containing protein n=2 Tax=Brachionus calyciflorus TaxID=104777 RepID=A0A814CHN0_9BILA|nr:unnamed protein product [Brachionus calyciflorus]